MLAKMWGKRNIYSLLVGVQTCRSTMKFIVDVPQETGNSSTSSGICQASQLLNWLGFPVPAALLPQSIGITFAHTLMSWHQAVTWVLES